jgi:hypothetical protein
MMEAREGRIFELGSMGECTSLGLLGEKLKHVGTRWSELEVGKRESGELVGQRQQQ